MSLLTRLRNLFRKGGAKVGMVKELDKITDDPRISVPSSEYERIAELKKYYKNDFKKLTYKNSYGEERKRQYKAINVDKMASRKIASLCFNEQCSVSVNDNSAQQLLDSIFEDNDFNLTFEEKLETWVALGDGVCRPYVDHNKIKLAWAQADQAYPLQSNTNEVPEIAISSRTMQVENDKNVYYTLLEFHQWQPNGDYTITNELYRSEQADEVGLQVPLNSLDQYSNLQQKVTISNLEKPLFAWYRNPGANNKCLSSPLGLGLIDNCKSTVDALNRTHDQFIWEVRTGGRRYIVPMSWLQPAPTAHNNPQQQAAHPKAFDPDINVYNGMYGDDANIGFHDATSDIRVQEYTDTMNYFLQEFENETGLSQGTFTQTPNGVQTATEVVTNNSTTYQTRSSYLTQVEKTIDALVDAILEIAANADLFDDHKARWSGNIDDIQTTVDFNDGLFVDQDKQFANDLQAHTAGIMPTKEFLMRDYNLDEATADKWLEELQDESSAKEPDFNELFGDGSNGGGDDGENNESEDDSGSGENS